MTRRTESLMTMGNVGGDCGLRRHGLAGRWRWPRGSPRGLRSRRRARGRRRRATCPPPRWLPRGPRSAGCSRRGPASRRARRAWARAGLGTHRVDRLPEEEASARESPARADSRPCAKAFVRSRDLRRVGIGSRRCGGGRRVGRGRSRCALHRQSGGKNGKASARDSPATSHRKKGNPRRRKNAKHFGLVSGSEDSAGVSGVTSEYRSSRGAERRGIPDS
jgi:hypothetical protein